MCVFELEEKSFLKGILQLGSYMLKFITEEWQKQEKLLS